MTPEEIENDRYNLIEVIKAKKENIEHWKSDGCGLDKPTANLSISIAEKDIAVFQKRLDDLPPVDSAPKEVEEVEEIETAKTEEVKDTIKEK